MKFYKNELGHIVSVEDRMWEEMKIIHPYAAEHEVGEEEAPKPEKKESEKPKTIDKLNTLKDENSSNTRAKPKSKATKKRTPKKGNGRVLGEAKKKPGRPKKIQASEGKQTK